MDGLRCPVNPIRIAARQASSRGRQGAGMGREDEAGDDVCRRGWPPSNSSTRASDGREQGAGAVFGLLVWWAACLTVACAAWPLGSRWPLVGSSTQGQAVATISMTELTQATPSAPHACAWRGQLFNRQCPTVRSPQRERPPSPAPLQHRCSPGIHTGTLGGRGGGYRGASLPPQGLPSPDDMEPFVHPAARVQQQWAGSPPAGNLQHPRNPV
jgi:hypothetical protein